MLDFGEVLGGSWRVLKRIVGEVSSTQPPFTFIPKGYSRFKNVPKERSQLCQYKRKSTVPALVSPNLRVRCRSP
jgi:hypothetical protein